MSLLIRPAIRPPTPTQPSLSISWYTAAAGIVIVLTMSAAFASADHRGERHRLPISLDAAEARVAERFAQVDTDGDGLVSGAEFDAMEPTAGQRHRFHSRHGENGKRRHHQRAHDAEASEDARAEREAARFGAIDSDGNGQISETEFSNRRASLKATHKALRFARLDTNADGQLAVEEFPSPLKWLKALDTNGDGQVTRDEFRSGAHHRRADS